MNNSYLSFEVDVMLHCGGSIIIRVIITIQVQISQLKCGGFGTHY